MSNDCIFCKLIAGDIPSTRVYEDDDTLAFMDIGPVTKGHTLVIPKQHCNPITHTPDEVLQKVIVITKRIAAAQLAGLGAEGVNVTQANGALSGQMVPHLHFHVIPRRDDDTPTYNWQPGTYDSPEEMKQYADRIIAALT